MVRFRQIINPIIGLSLLLLLWEGIVATGRYEPALLPSPFTVGRAMGELLQNGALFQHFQVSLLRFSAGYFSAVLTAVLLGLILGRIQAVWAVIDPIVQVLRPISPIAWFPFIVLWFGIGDIPAIVIIFIAAFFPVLLSTVSGVGKVDATYLKVARNFGISGHHLLIKVIYPAAFPFIANGLHLALGAAWVFLVAGEMVGAQSGLGYLIIDARNSLRSDMVLAGIILIGVTGLILDQCIRLFEEWIARRWGLQQNERLG